MMLPRSTERIIAIPASVIAIRMIRAIIRTTPDCARGGLIRSGALAMLLISIPGVLPSRRRCVAAPGFRIPGSDTAATKQFGVPSGFVMADPSGFFETLMRTGVALPVPCHWGAAGVTSSFSYWALRATSARRTAEVLAHSQFVVGCGCGIVSVGGSSGCMKTSIAPFIGADVSRPYCARRLTTLLATGRQIAGLSRVAGVASLQSAGHEIADGQISVAHRVSQEPWRGAQVEKSAVAVAGAVAAIPMGKVVVTTSPFTAALCSLSAAACRLRSAGAGQELGGNHPIVGAHRAGPQPSSV